MGLENKVRFAYWIDLGMVDYEEAFRLQSELAKLRHEERINDVILTAQHYPVISFGAGSKNNGFSPEFLAEVNNKFGNTEQDTIIKYLEELGIRFHKGDSENGTTRGSGSIYIGPGQILFYPIVNYRKIIGETIGMGVQQYKSLIDQIMQTVLQEYFDINAQRFKVTDLLPDNSDDASRSDRKDVWVEKDGKYFKIGAKGVHFDHDIAYHGFSLFVKNEGLRGFDKILVCGYPKDQLYVTSIEDESSEEIDLDVVVRCVKDIIGRYFNYAEIIDATLDQVVPMQEAE